MPDDLHPRHRLDPFAETPSASLTLNLPASLLETRAEAMLHRRRILHITTRPGDEVIDADGALDDWLEALDSSGPFDAEVLQRLSELVADPRLRDQRLRQEMIALSRAAHQHIDHLDALDALRARLRGPA